MPAFTRENTRLAIDIELGQQYRAEAAGMVIALETWASGLDTTRWFKDLPDGACQEHHFGYMVSGAATVTYADGRTERFAGGQAYYLEPGHNVRLEEDSEFVEFTPADQAPGINTLPQETAP
jgi:hypothetical protein